MSHFRALRTFSEELGFGPQNRSEIGKYLPDLAMTSHKAYPKGFRVGQSEYGHSQGEI